jgi:hypothetical protein
MRMPCSWAASMPEQNPEEPTAILDVWTDQGVAGWHSVAHSTLRRRRPPSGRTQHERGGIAYGHPAATPSAFVQWRTIGRIPPLEHHEVRHLCADYWSPAAIRRVCPMLAEGDRFEDVELAVVEPMGPALWSPTVLAASSLDQGLSVKLQVGAEHAAGTTR